MKNVKVGFHFNALEVSFNVKANNHVNEGRVGQELLVPLSEFEGGGVRVDNGDSSHVISLEGGPKVWETGQRHTVLPWKGDDRLVLTAFSVPGSGWLSEDDMDCLSALGFEWHEHFVSPPSPMAPFPTSSASLRTIRMGSIKDSGGVTSELQEVQADMDLVIQDLEKRAERLRSLLEEEEILNEEYSRMAEGTRETLDDTSDQVAKFLEEIHERMNTFERLKTLNYLKAARVV